MRVDLGGIGKGYAVDLMAELLEDWGLERSLVHGGFSSVLALEPPAGGDGWPLTLSDPRDAVAGAGAALGAPDGARRVGRAQEATTSWIRAPASRSAGGSRRGSRCRGRTGRAERRPRGPRIAAAP